MNGDIIVEQIYPYTAEVVWQALIEPAAIAEWLMPNDFAPVVGHRFQFRTKPQQQWNGIVDCEVLRVEPYSELSYSWSGGTMVTPTIVTFTLKPVADGTSVRLAHTGFEGADGMMLSEMLANGWKSKIMISSLPAVVARLATQPPLHAGSSQ
jgi:uncharacterized protein YndB with AHSA1/START domain